MNLVPFDVDIPKVVLALVVAHHDAAIGQHFEHLAVVPLTVVHDLAGVSRLELRPPLAEGGGVDYG